MKKFTVLSSLFLFVFGLTIGMTIAMHDQASALEQCQGPCSGYYECTTETGTNCPFLMKPNYRYFVPTCSGGPGNCPGNPYFVGCCNPDIIVIP